MLLKITQRNYLRVRGEYGFTTQDTTYTLELPPRARRIRHLSDPIDNPIGTTSACAENTGCASIYPASPRNYLRVRGEYAAADSG